MHTAALAQKLPTQQLDNINWHLGGDGFFNRSGARQSSAPYSGYRLMASLTRLFVPISGISRYLTGVFTRLCQLSFLPLTAILLPNVRYWLFWCYWPQPSSPHWVYPTLSSTLRPTR